MAATSPSLLCKLSRRNSSFVKRFGDNETVSADPLNLTNKYLPRFQGSLHPKALGVALNKTGGVTLRARSVKKAQKPSSGVYKVNVNKAGFRPTAKTISALSSQAGRPDLKKAALARYTRLHSVLHFKSGGVSKPRFQSRHSKNVAKKV